MNNLNNILNQTYLNNELWRYCLFAGVLLVSMIAGKVFQFSFNKSSAKFGLLQKPLLALTFKALSKRIYFISFAIGLIIADQCLLFTPNIESIFNSITSIILVIGIGLMALSLVEIPSYWLANAASSKGSPMGEMIVPAIHRVLQATVVMLAGVQIAQILSDKPVSSILAGLGIGGLAVGLAAKDSIANLFGSLVIFTDKPFELGDRVTIAGTEGLVEQVGMRSTKLRTLCGHLVTIPNSDLANKTIENISKRPHIKKVMNVGITYDTPAEKVQEALSILRELLNNHEGMKEKYPPRVYFNDFKDCSLNIMVIFWYHPVAYWDFLAFCENLNINILKRFNEAGIEFAFPSQSLYLKNYQANEAFKVAVEDKA